MQYFQITLVSFRQCTHVSSPWQVLLIHANNRLTKSAKSNFCKRFNPSVMLIDAGNAGFIGLSAWMSLCATLRGRENNRY